MKIKAIETFLVTLPFRFAFGHSLATRADSTNIIVRVTLEDGTQGYGEGVPRDYVTGENAGKAQELIDTLFAPRLLGIDVSSLPGVVAVLENLFFEFDLHKQARGAAWCAVELAVLDAAARAHRTTVAKWFGPVQTPRVRYGGVIPFGGHNAVFAMLLFYKLYGFETVKVKVGRTLEHDLANVAMARRIMGPDAIIRVDANCAWTVDETLRAAEAFAPYSVASFEQPVPPEDLQGLQRITAQLGDVQVLVDESLCTLEQAEMLASEKICSAFNIRLSKVGGFLTAKRIVQIARKYGISCHMGAQVGESGILSAAARTFAAVNKDFDNCEGSMNGFLLKHDLTPENLTVKPGGWGDLNYARKQPTGFCFSIGEGTLESWQTVEEPAMTHDHSLDIAQQTAHAQSDRRSEVKTLAG
jgi:L-alanine-DL-glutamate epimerase-like enolase superfamily enzyme